MSMRSQVYEWTGSRTDGSGQAPTAAQAGQRISVLMVDSATTSQNLLKQPQPNSLLLKISQFPHLLSFNPHPQAHIVAKQSLTVLQVQEPMFK